MVKLMRDKRYMYVLDNKKPTFYDLENKDIFDVNETEELLNELFFENQRLEQKINIKDCLIQQYRNELNNDCYKEARKYQKEFMRISEELADAYIIINELEGDKDG